MTTTLPTPEPASAPWSEYLARQRAERAADAQQAAAKARAEATARRIAILDVLEDEYGLLFSTAEIVERLQRRRIDATTASVEADLLALTAADHVLDCLSLTAGDGPRWRSSDGLSRRVRLAGLRALVAEVESGPAGVDGGEG